MLKHALLTSILSMAALPAFSQTITGNEFQTGQAGKAVVGTVLMCLDSSGVAVPASTGTCANPIAVTGTFTPPANNSTAINDGATAGQKASVGANGALLTSAVSPYPLGAVPVTSSSGNVANAAAVATLAGTSGKTTYICGFEIDGAGSTTAITVNPTVAGSTGGTMTYLYGVGVAAAGSISPQLQVAYNPCVPASAANTAIVVTLPALGLGNLNAIAVAHGYQL